MRRLALVRAPTDVAGLSVAAVRDVLTAIDEPGSSPHDVLGSAQPGLPAAAPEPSPRPTANRPRAGSTRWSRNAAGGRHRGSPLIETLAGVLCTYRAVGHEWTLDNLSVYAEHADRVAAADIEAPVRLDSAENIVEGAVVGTVVGDSLLATLRRMAHAEASRKRFGRT